jgi:hypothetical protein
MKDTIMNVTYELSSDLMLERMVVFRSDVRTYGCLQI